MSGCGLTLKLPAILLTIHYLNNRQAKCAKYGKYGRVRGGKSNLSANMHFKGIRTDRKDSRSFLSKTFTLTGYIYSKK